MEYILDDFAYLLGLTCGRGRIDYAKKVLSIIFPFRLISIKVQNDDIKQRDKMIIGLDDIVNRLADFTGKHVIKHNDKSQVELIVPFISTTHTFQGIEKFFAGKSSFREFIIPEDFFNAPLSVKKNFLQGLADTAGFITRGNANQSGRYRVYIEISFHNWNLPIQICRLLQEPDISIPVQTITWGHPNMRGEKTWAKEHQIKIFAEYFRKIGFTIEYKNRILIELSEINERMFPNAKLNFCYPANKRYNIKKYNSDIHSDRLPTQLQGVHFNAFWEICRSMGCNRCN